MFNHSTSNRLCNHLFIFDEIQDCPKVINSMKYFCENAPEYHIACASSLLGIALAKPASLCDRRHAGIDSDVDTGTRRKRNADRTFRYYRRKSSNPRQSPCRAICRSASAGTHIWRGNIHPSPSRYMHRQPSDLNECRKTMFLLRHTGT